MTSDPTGPARLFVWAWLPGATDPVVVGALAPTGQRLGPDAVLAFAYARSYRARPDAISLFPPDLPLGAGTIDPTRPGARVTGPGTGTPWRGWPSPAERSPTALAGCLRDAAPDAWGRRVINLRHAGDPDVDLDETTYLLGSASDRIGALDFQTSPTDYRPRGERATLEQLVEAAERIERGEPVPPDLAAAAGHGTSIGGARPKALLDGDGAEAGSAGRPRVAKFSSSTDDRPVVKAEAVGMLLAARVGIDVPQVEVVSAAGRDVLLVDRFDRTPEGGRRLMVSALTVLGLREEEARYASYADLAQAIRHHGWADPERQLRELFTRLVLNIAISNTDDHLRNHAAFWDGTSLRLTPAYDLAPQRRSTTVAAQAIGIGGAGSPRVSQFRVAVDAAGRFTLARSEAEEIVAHVVGSITGSWDEVCDEARLTGAERDLLWGREILPPYASWPEA